MGLVLMVAIDYLKWISQTLSILGQMKIDGHIDPDLSGIFTHKQIELKYAEDHLDEK